MEDRWRKLWSITTSEPEGDATITVDPENVGEVTLTWSDGSVVGLYWRNEDWHFAEMLVICPGD